MPALGLCVEVHARGFGMAAGDEYREKAAEIASRARQLQDPLKRVRLEALEASFLRLALQADKNAKSDTVYQTPQVPDRPVAQQQQQIQPKKQSDS